MTEVQITNGSVKYGETRKTGDFESKRADVELSFNVPEGKNADELITKVAEKAKEQVFTILGIGKPVKPLHGSSDTTTTQTVKSTPRMPKITETPAQASKAEAQTANLKRQVEVIEGCVPTITGGDLSVIEEPEVKLKHASEFAPGITDITDLQLMDATRKHQELVKNPVSIRKLINELGVIAPPGRLIDLSQDKRQEYLDKLVLIKPLV